MIYESPKQLRALTMVTLDTPPYSFDITLNGLQRNKDGLYSFSDMMERFDEKIGAYDQLQKDYAE